jgi:hypothetical protein
MLGGGGPSTAVVLFESVCAGNAAGTIRAVRMMAERILQGDVMIMARNDASVLV